MEKPLIVVQVESKNRKKRLETLASFEVYSQEGKKLNLSICGNQDITIVSSIELDSTKTIEASEIQDLLDKGINVFNANDSFFNDKSVSCTTKTNKKDITLADRSVEMNVKKQM